MIKREAIHATLGKTFADKIDLTVIDVSDEIHYTRRELVDFIGCANFKAASLLNKALRKLKITTIKGLYKVDPLSLYRIKGVGDTTVFVAMCILDAHKYNVMDWWAWRDDDQKKAAIARAKKYLQEVA